MQKLLRKITPATVCPELRQRLDHPKAPKEVVLYDLYGVTNRVKTGETAMGQWTQFKGQFEAITQEGEIVSSGACHIPQPMEDMLLSELTRAQENDKNGTVRFACRVSIVPPTPGKVSATGYEYQCRPLLENEGTNPLNELRKLVAEKTRLLSANAGE